MGLQGRAPGLRHIAHLSGILLALFWSPTSATAGFEQPLRHGVVFWQPKTSQEAVAKLAQVKADGFNLIKLASWVWTLPKPGSDLETVAEAMLDWCDANDMRFFLLHNIQYGSPGEGGDLDRAFADPLAAAPLLEDWVRVLEGHPCVAGVILGNEVWPMAGTPEKNPRWWAGLRDAMRDRYGDVAALNTAWATDFDSWEALALPPDDSPGRVDLGLFATEVYARFYGTLFDEVIRPALGDLEYGTKTGGEPILHRRLSRFSMITWDDVLANYPQWRIKALCDIGRALDKPVFNSELHLYHDTYIFNQSPEMSRYRYLTSALNGETTTASFAWDHWSREPTAAVHARTPEILAELSGLEPEIHKLAAVGPELHVLLTPSCTEGRDDHPDAKPLAEKLYAQFACTGRPWEFTCEPDVHALTGGTLVIPPGALIAPATVRSITSLPPEVRVVSVGPPPALDHYGQPLPAGLAAEVASRARVVSSVAELITPEGDPGPPYNQLGATEYLWWSHEKGHFRGPMTCPVLEARRVREGVGWLVAVINHATDGEPVAAGLPWAETLRPSRVIELTGGAIELSPNEVAAFPPLDVRVFRYE